MHTETHVRNHNRAIVASECGHYDRRMVKRWLNSLRAIVRQTQRTRSNNHVHNRPNDWERALRKLARDVFNKPE